MYPFLFEHVSPTVNAIIRGAIGRYYEARFGGIWAKFIEKSFKKDC